MIIIDNFLPESYHNDLSNLMEGPDFPWYFNKYVTQSRQDDGSYYFTHHALDVTPEGSMHTEYFNRFQAMLYFMEEKAKFRIESLYRIKCGLYPNIGYAKKNEWHIDRSEHHYVGLYYVNSSDGPTDFKDTSVECVANRFVLFDGTHYHRSTHPTDIRGRININFNMSGYFLS